MTLRPQDSTGRLLAAVHGGDSRAITWLFNRHFSWLRRWTAGRLPPAARNGIDTADLVQETLAAALGRLLHFSPRHAGAFRAYLRRSVQNRVYDEIRRAQRQHTIGDIEVDEIPSPEPSPLDDLLGRESSRAFALALSALTTTDQMAVVSRYQMQYTYEQIAHVLDKRSADSARKVVTRALVRLAREMSRVAPPRCV